MNTKKDIFRLIVTLVLSTTLLAPPTPVNAGILDWFGFGNNAETVYDISIPDIPKSASFDLLYNTITAIQIPKQDYIFGFDTFNESYVNFATDTTNTLHSSALTVQASGYSSTVDQTDSTPFITASGTFVRDGIIAANFLPMGTVVKIPEIYGEKLFIVEDRMNSRYQYHIDIWFPDRESALQFGRQNVQIEVLALR